MPEKECSRYARLTQTVKTVLFFFLLCIVWFILSRHSVMFGSLSTLQCRIRRMNKFAGIETDCLYKSECVVSEPWKYHCDS